MERCEMPRFPLREQWTISVDSKDKESKVNFFVNMSGGPGVFITTDSLDKLPELIRKGEQLVKRQKAICRGSRMGGWES